MIQQKNTALTKQYPWPAVKVDQLIPIWTGTDFKIGDEFKKVLSYDASTSGWTDQLTAFHEEHAAANHPIDLASRSAALDQLVKFFANSQKSFTDQKPVILEIGCSSGFMLKELQQKFSDYCIIGSDIIPEALEKLAATGISLPLLQFNLLNCPLPSNSIDAIVLLNVLEHIEDHAAALKQIYRILKPGGLAVIEVPAGPGLYDVYDQVLLHFRRYHLADLVEILKEAGFEIIRRSHLGFFVFPFFYLVKKKNRRFLKSTKAVQQEVVAQSIQNTRSSWLMQKLMKFELGLGRYISYPIGIRCLVSCLKPL